MAMTKKKKAVGGKHGKPAATRPARGAKVTSRPVAEVKLNPTQRHKTPTM